MTSALDPGTEARFGTCQSHCSFIGVEASANVAAQVVSAVECRNLQDGCLVDILGTRRFVEEPGLVILG